MERMTKIDENIQTAQNLLSGIVERCYELEEENKKLKSDLSECECSMHFENDEVGYRKRECKKLKEELRYYKEKTEFLNKVIVKYQEEDELDLYSNENKNGRKDLHPLGEMLKKNGEENE